MSLISYIKLIKRKNAIKRQAKLKRTDPKKALRKFVHEKLFVGFISSLLINYYIQKNALKEIETLTLTDSEPTLFKALLPFVFIVPFFVSFDSVKQSYKKTAKMRLPFDFPENYKWGRQGAKMGAKNALICGLVTIGVLGSAYFFSPHIVVEKWAMVWFITLLSGVFSLSFSMQGIHWVIDNYYSEELAVFVNPDDTPVEETYTSNESKDDVQIEVIKSSA